MRLILLDTNLLLLLLVGLTSRSYISRHKNLSAYTVKDFDALYELLAIRGFQIVTTPNILTETSNLLNQVHNPIRAKVSALFAAVLKGDHHHRLTEHYVPSLDAMKRPEFMWLGLSDAATLEYLEPEALFVTTDKALYHEVLKQKRDARLFIRELDPA